MKVLSVATVLAVMSTPVLARDANHWKHVHHHHRHVVFVDGSQSFAMAGDGMSEGWQAQASAPGFAPPITQGQGEYTEMVARHAAANGVPASLVNRVIMRESRYNPRAISKGNYGMMQIRLGTARAMGYGGTAAGLLDPEVNMTYAVKYLAGAYQAAGGSETGAVARYARGYYREAKNLNMSPYAAPNQGAVARVERFHTGFNVGAPLTPDRNAVF
jgi:soluble lytic murein transglycosylase-like protein